MTNGLVYLMYHELELPERRLCQNDAGYVRYALKADGFREQVAHLRAENFRGISVGEALSNADEKKKYVVVTFDDGCETDLIVAAPVLREADFNATFYVTVEHLGRRGYLSVDQLRELSDSGFEIGSHSLTHSYLHDLKTDEIRAEVSGSKERLEEITGKRIAHFSCPGGRWDKRVSEIVREAGYDSLVTSQIGTNTPETDSFRLSRVPVMRGIGIEEFARTVHGRGLGRRRAQSAVLNVAKHVLGNSIYEKLRSTVLGQATVERRVD
ncbi:MAG TPA: polysaccharide deacetylase family protein [Pyrinomonadaceae bacterium]